MMYDRIINFFRPHTFADEQTTRRAVYLVAFCKLLIFGAIVINVLRAIFIPSTLQAATGITLVIILLMAGIIALARDKRWLPSASLLLTLLFFSTLMLSALLSGGIRSTGYFGGVTISILVGGLLIGWHGIRVIVVMGVLVGVGMVIAEINGLLPPSSPFVSPVSVFVTENGMFAVIIGLLYTMMRDLWQREARLREELSARQQTEAALKLSEQRYRALVANLPNTAIILFDLDLQFVLVDGPEVENSGYSREMMIGKRLHEALPPDFAAQAEPNMRAVLEGKRFTAELPFGDQIHRYFYQPLEDESGRIIYGMILAQNITAQRRAEIALRESEESLRHLSDAAVEGIGITHEGRIILNNNRLAQMLGYERDELIGKSVLEFVAPASRDLVVQHTHLNTPHIYEHVALRKDGTTFPVEIQGSQMTYQGLAVRVVSIRDITERKRADETLRQSELKFRTVFDIAPYTITIQRVEDDRFVDVNRTTYELMGLRREDFIGRTPDEVGLPSFATDYRRNLLRKMKANGGFITGEEVPGWFQGQRVTLLYAAKELELEGQQLVLTATVDISKLKQVEAELRLMNEQLEERVATRTSQLLAANQELEAFTYSVSHDLRAPLRAIHGFSNTMLQNYASELPEKAQHYLDRVQANAQRMSGLIDDLLALSRLGRKELQHMSVDMNALVKNMLLEFMANGEWNGVDVILADLPLCYGDPSLVQQVWSNLIANALKYSSKQPCPRIEIGARQEDAQTIYFVTDNGVGFDMKYADKLFGIFQRLHSDREFEGTGIGLAIVKRVVARHGGRVWAEGQVGKGATFYFIIDGVSRHS